MTKQLTLEKLNKIIQRKYPKLLLIRGKGYFYLSSNDDDLGLQLAGLYSASIHVNSIKYMGIDQWLESVDFVLADKNQSNKFDRRPVKF